MPDSNAVAHPFDAKKINVNDPYEMKQWIKMFECTEVQPETGGQGSRHLRQGDQKTPQEVRAQPRHKPGPARGAFLLLTFIYNISLRQQAQHLSGKGF